MWGIAHTSRNTPLAPAAIGPVCKAVLCNFLRRRLAYLSQTRGLKSMGPIIANRDLALACLLNIAAVRLTSGLSR